MNLPADVYRLAVDLMRTGAPLDTLRTHGLPPDVFVADWRRRQPPGTRWHQTRALICRGWDFDSVMVMVGWTPAEYRAERTRRRAWRRKHDIATMKEAV